MNTLIANTGIQFFSEELEFDPNSPLELPNGKNLKYTFVEIMDFIQNRITFDVCVAKGNFYMPLNYLRKNNLLEKNTNDTVNLDDFGVPKVVSTLSPAVVQSFAPGAPELMSINTLGGYMIKDAKGAVSAFDRLIGSWLPMPMFELAVGGVSQTSPKGWCRVKIDKVGGNEKTGVFKYRLVWAFDTKVNEYKMGEIVNRFDSKTLLRPIFIEGEPTDKTFALCNRVDNLFDFLSISEGGTESAISDYLVAKLNLDLNAIGKHKYKFIGWYIYLINFIRLKSTIGEIKLYNRHDNQIPVDLSLDIGNSRTCAVLFENGSFRDAKQLGLRDLSKPWLPPYDSAFDMRIVFRRADFGNDLIVDDDMFNWASLVRVGEEAKHLTYRSVETMGLSERQTNYSSPKRYLWDNKEYDGRWEFLISEDDPTHVQVNPRIFIKNFTEYFDKDGTFLGHKKEIPIWELGNDNSCHFSRSSLMTFVMIEIFQQAYSFINSNEWTRKWGNYDSRRYLRNVVITCPTAMPIQEQITLRESAQNAYKLLKKLNPSLPEIVVTPSPDKLKVTDDTQWEDRGWTYDEAFASQLVYLCAEITEKYNGENDKVIEMKGHVRPEHIAEGYDRKSLTIGSIDIGAGTTDIMICSYQYDGRGQAHLTPSPLFWDSFYLAGDDIMKNLILGIVVEGTFNNDANMGCIYSALEYRMLRMTDDELAALPIVANNTLAYGRKIESIRRAQNSNERESRIKDMAITMLHDYFGVDSAMMGFKDRICRNDFNTQISMHIAQYFLQLLVGKYPAKTYSYDDIFATSKPSEYLLTHFEAHFGFKFQELNWRFEPEEVANHVRYTLEPLMKQLSIVLSAYDCDIVVLSGRPCSLDVVTELFVKYYPLSPDRLIRLGNYVVGNWYPLADGRGKFIDQKSVVAVGAMVGFMSTTQGFNGMDLDFRKVIKNMKSTAKYIGIYNSRSRQVEEALFTPNKNNVTLNVSSFPVFLGCRQFDAPNYSARPLFKIDSDRRSLRLMLQRSYTENRELIEITDITDAEGNDIPLKDVSLTIQSIAEDGKYWLDKGEFELSLNIRNK